MADEPRFTVEQFVSLMREFDRTNPTSGSTHGFNWWMETFVSWLKKHDFEEELVWKIKRKERNGQE